MTNQQNSNPLGNLLSIFIVVLIFVGLWYLAKGIFTLLYWLAPILIILTLILDHKVIVNYGKWVGNLFRRNWVTGLVVVLLTMFFYPIVAGFLFAKTLVKRQVGKMTAEYEQRIEGEYVDYEEVDTATPPTPPETLELDEPQPKRKPIKETRQRGDNSGSEYDDLFE